MSNNIIVGSVLLFLLVLSACSQNSDALYVSPQIIEDCRNLSLSSYDDSDPIQNLCYVHYGMNHGVALCGDDDESYLCSIGVAAAMKNDSYCGNDPVCSLWLGAGVAEKTFCERLTSPVERDYCLLGVAISRQEENLCTQFTSEEGRFLISDCYAMIARITLNEELCPPTEEGGDQCIRTVMLRRALQENNPHLCIAASEYYPDDEIVRCVSTIAVRQQNRTICEDHLTDHEEDYCLTDIFVAEGNISACQTVSRYERCYSEILATHDYPEQTCASFEGRPFAQCYKQLQCNNSKDPASCKQLVWEAERNTDLCQYEDHDVAVKKCFNRIAVLTLQPALCFKGIRDECFESFARATGNITYCELAGERGTPCFRGFNTSVIIQYKNEKGMTDIPACQPFLGWDREECYYKQAQIEEEPSYCRQVGGVMTACYEELALKLANPDLCQGDRCFRILAESLKRPTLCDNITSIEQRYWCYKDLALKLNNPALCNNAAHDIKDMCFFEYVQATGNQNLCHQIVSETRKETCFRLPG